MKSNILERTRDHITALCRKHRVRHLYAFGSVLTPRFNDHSDIDFLVDFDTAAIPDYLTNYFELKHSLEAALGRSVDLVEEQAIRNPIFKRNVERTKTVVYGGKNEVGKAERPLRRLERG